MRRPVIGRDFGGLVANFPDLVPGSSLASFPSYFEKDFADFQDSKVFWHGVT